MLVAVAGIVAALARTARTDGVGGFGFALDGDGGRAVRPPEAHPLSEPLPPIPGDLSGGPVIAPPRGSRRLLRPDGTPRPGPMPRSEATAPPGLSARAPVEQPDLGLLDPDPGGTHDDDRPPGDG